MKKSLINKIIYFDKETIQNILQEQNKGSILKQIDFSTTTEGTGEVNVETKIKLGVPFLERLTFLFAGKLSLSYLIKRDSKTTISSTEISEFENLKPSLACMENVEIYDIENSSTFLRVAGGYLKIVKGGIEEVDTKEFKNVMDSYDGYDTYKINENKYVRFNNTAFVSNYKRNDLLTTKMTLYCISVGKFMKKRFDFIDQIEKMEGLISGVESKKTLNEMFPPKNIGREEEQKQSINIRENTGESIELFDVIYACIEEDDKDK